MFESYSADHTYYQLIIYADKQMIIEKCYNAPQDDPLSGVENASIMVTHLRSGTFCARCSTYLQKTQSLNMHFFIELLEVWGLSEPRLLAEFQLTSSAAPFERFSRMAGTG